MMNKQHFPRVIYSNSAGWEIIMCAPRRFRLICDSGGFGYIGCFSSKASAIRYMINEFLG